MVQIEERIEKERGCGYRKPGGMYLVGGKLSAPCGKLPVPLDVCPCCSGGIKQTRSVQWITSALLAHQECTLKSKCDSCNPFNLPSTERIAMMWVGEKYYPTSADFLRESREQGVSKRIATIPKGFIVGKTWVVLAHPKAILDYSNPSQPPTYRKGIFMAYQPERVEYVVTGQESEADLEKLQERGLTLVRVKREVSVQVHMLEEE